MRVRILPAVLKKRIHTFIEFKCGKIDFQTPLKYIPQDLLYSSSGLATNLVARPEHVSNQSQTMSLLFIRINH